MHHIRPFQLLTLASGNVTLPIPPRRGSLGGAPSLLETFLLISAIRAVDAKAIFEFGTCKGTTALNLAINSDAKITTLDLYRDPEFDFNGTEYESRIDVKTSDSKKFSYMPYLKSMDFVFIDGGHDYDTVKNDTEAAFELAKESGCIAWHDYREPTCSGIAHYLDTLSEGMDLFHIEDTVLCFWFPEAIATKLCKPEN